MSINNLILKPRNTVKYFKYFITILLTLAWVFPFFIAFLMSFKAPSDIGEHLLSLPEKIYWGNYIDVITKNAAFRTGFINSVISTFVIVSALTLICSTAAWVIARNKRKIYSIIYYLFLAGILIPFQCIMFPTYLNLRAVGLMNTLTGFIVVRIGFQIAICILTMTSFVKTVPRELEEAASVDGANPFTTFWKIVFPLMKPINVSMLVINTLFAWNDFYVSVTILQSADKRTLPLAQFMYISEGSMDLNAAFAFFTLCMIPVLVIYLLVQKYIVSGITAGAVKG